MARPAKWNTPTESVRLPAHAIEQCLKLAQLLDKESDQGFVQNLNPLLVTINEEKFLIQPEPLSQAELQQVERMCDNLLQRMDEVGLREDNRLLVFAGLVKAWGRKIGGGKDAA